jgi:dihydrolipoamide dehydrogenase
MANHSFDLVVVGGGPGGYVAAIRAAQLGMKTALVEREHLGGICLNWGCIPTKALLRSAEVYDHMGHPEAYGLSVQGRGFDAAAVVKRSRNVASQLSGGVKHLLKKNKVTVFDGSGSLAGKNTLKVSTKGGEETVPGPACFRGSSRMASWSGPTRKPWCPRRCPSRCWWWAVAPSASSSRHSTAPWAPT